jgi:hypothetical protein
MKKINTQIKNYFINYLDSYIKKSFKKDYLKDPAMMSYSPTIQKVDLTADHQRTNFNEIFLNVWCGGNIYLKNKIYANWGVKLYLLNSVKLITKTLLWLETIFIFRNFDFNFFKSFLLNIRQKIYDKIIFSIVIHNRIS